MIHFLPGPLCSLLALARFALVLLVVLQLALGTLIRCQLGDDVVSFMPIYHRRTP
jgi:hypothetical protein